MVWNPAGGGSSNQQIFTDALAFVIACPPATSLNTAARVIVIASWLAPSAWYTDPPLHWMS
jgi:hypothetical protein